MKLRYMLFILIALSIAGAAIHGCERSEGLKYGTLQKISHKTSPCDYYVAEFSYEGGRVEGDDKAKAYSNTQEVEIDKIAFDSLQSYLGEKVIFDYEDKGLTFCGEGKKLTMIRRKGE